MAWPPQAPRPRASVFDDNALFIHQHLVNRFRRDAAGAWVMNSMQRRIFPCTSFQQIQAPALHANIQAPTGLHPQPEDRAHKQRRAQWRSLALAA